MYPSPLRLIASQPDPDSPDQSRSDPLADVPDAAIPVRRVEPAKGPQHRTGQAGRFVKGPLALDWIGAAAHSDHAKAPLMLLALRFKADASREAWVKPPFRVLTGWGFSADDRSRAIRALERAGLVEVHRRKGRPPLVRLLPWRRGSDG
jgi:hypothetical protein